MPQRTSKSKRLELLTRPGDDKSTDDPKGGATSIRGRMSAFAYFLRTCREEHRKLFPNETVEFVSFTKKCSDKWRIMTPTQRERFTILAKKDKLRYHLEVQLRGVREPVVKDKNAPKRAVTAFFYFSQEERSKVRQDHPTFNVGEISKEVSKRWKALSKTDKAKYEEKGDKDRQRYQTEMEAYKKTLAKKKKNAAPEDEDDDVEDFEDFADLSEDDSLDDEDEDDGRLGSELEEEDEYRDENEDLPFSIM